MVAKFIGGPGRNDKDGRALQPRTAAPQAPSPWRNSRPPPRQNRPPNASLIYGAAAIAMLGIGLYYLLIFKNTFTALLLLLLAGALGGYAWYFMRYR